MAYRQTNRRKYGESQLSNELITFHLSCVRSDLSPSFQLLNSLKYETFDT